MFNPSRRTGRLKKRENPDENVNRGMSANAKIHQLVQRSATAPTITVPSSSANSTNAHTQLPHINKPQRTYSFKPKRLRFEILFCVPPNIFYCFFLSSS